MIVKRYGAPVDETEARRPAGGPGPNARKRVSARQVVLAPIEGGGAVEHVARRLGEAIGAGVLAAGERLPSEAELARQLRVSVMTLREALRALRDAGLIETRRGRHGGSFVSAAPEPRITAARPAPSADELRELTDWRQAISGAATELAARRRTEQDQQTLADAQAAVGRAVADASAYRIADARFHVAIAEVARSRRLVAAEAAIQAELGEVLESLPSSEQARRTSHASHAAIVSAIADGAPDVARAAALRHVDGTHDWVVGLLLGKLPRAGG